MFVKNYIYSDKWDKEFDDSLDSNKTIVFLFSSMHEEKVKEELEKIYRVFKNSLIVGASTSGEILDDDVYDDTIVMSVVRFEKTTFKYFCKDIEPDNSFNDGIEAAVKLNNEKLKGVFILTDGIKTNGSQLIKGLTSVLLDNVVISGGLAGDKDRFEKTWVVHNGDILESFMCAIGFYGDEIHFKASSKGGWDRLGLTRVVTKSKENVLYEIDNQPALEIYKKYLGEKAKELPASALLFPLEVKEEGCNEGKVRTIIGIDEKNKALVFAGDIPQNSHVTLMKANFDRLISGAEDSAYMLDLTEYKNGDLLCIAISCVGRKLVLKSRTFEEVEVIKDVLPEHSNLIGFYSYGEISPLASGTCDLHNQTMTLTVFWED